MKRREVITLVIALIVAPLALFLTVKLKARPDGRGESPVVEVLSPQSEQVQSEARSDELTQQERAFSSESDLERVVQSGVGRDIREIPVEEGGSREPIQEEPILGGQDQAEVSSGQTPVTTPTVASTEVEPSNSGLPDDVLKDDGSGVESLKQSQSDTEIHRKNWDNHFPEFLQELARILGDDPQWPHRAPGHAFECRNKAGETIALLPQTFPLPVVPPDRSVADQETTGKFLFRTVRWELKIESIRKDPEGKLDLEFERPDPTKIHPSLREFNHFSASVKERAIPFASAMKKGDQVIVTGKFAEPMGLLLFLGVGPDQGKIKMSLILDEVDVSKPEAR